ncbi:rhodanese-like domain-containing protein [Streptomyces sp. NPDC001070]
MSRPTTVPSGIDRLLARARARLERIGPEQAATEIAAGESLLVDIRPAAQRASEGEFADALVIERNVLEWRLDPLSDARIPEATGPDVRWIVACSEGYTSSLAAASLLDVGLARATDLEGGFQAWLRAGLPVKGAGAPGGSS